MSRVAYCLLFTILLLTSTISSAQSQMDSLIVAAHSDSSKKPALIKALLAGHVVVIASWESPQSTSITFQDFIRNGQSYIPIFSSDAEFKAEAAGSGFESRGVSIDANFLASMLKGTELLVLNPGGPHPIDLPAAALKAGVDATRLPKP